jgi:hypothetical protein
MPHRFFAGLGVAALAALSACASPVGGIPDDPTHPASPSAPTAPAFTFSHSLLDVDAATEPSAEVSAGSGAPPHSGAQVDHGAHGGAGP